MKVKIVEHFKSSEDNISRELIGILNDNRIVYTIGEFKHTIDISKHILKRESDMVIYVFDFDNAICSLTLKDKNLKLDIPMKIYESIFNEGNICLRYYLDEDEYNVIEYILNYDVM